ncbi:hypothetical protein pSalSNUABM01_114 [Salmonella phage pSal-SNUABM-01]|nr:hypothetical protein pSalSNUABM01_114 [Salmonella phage pSal-SNUABM-01]
MTTTTTSKIVITAAIALGEVVKSEGSILTRARRDRFRFNIETTAAKVLRKIISENLRDLNLKIREGKGGHSQKALVAARNFLAQQYTELMADALQYKFHRVQMSQFIDAQNGKVLALDAAWEEAKAKEAAN